MNKKHGFLFGFAVIAIAAIVTFTGCTLDEEEKDSGPSPTGITYSSSGGFNYLDIAFTGLYAFNSAGAALTDFAVTEGGTAITINGSSVDEKKIRLRLASALTTGSHTIKVVYTAGTGKIVYLDDKYKSHDLGSFTIEKSVTVGN